MSLIGSLEDLSLGDILQIISLSQKSGVLNIRGEEGDGRILFRDGLVRAAHIKGGADSLRSILVDGGFVSGEDYAAALERFRGQGCSLEDALAIHASISRERIDSLRREAVESAVVMMFAWRTGEFSFDVGNEETEVDESLLLPMGVNAQYLAMEGLRLRDEATRGEGEASSADPNETQPFAHAATSLMDGGEDAAASAEAFFGIGSTDHAEAPADASAEAAGEAAVDALVEAVAHPITDSEAHRATEIFGVLESPTLVEDAALPQEPVASAPERQEGESPPSAEPAAERPPVVVIEPELAVLEWVKAALSDDFEQVHIFQRSEQGLNRIRQYLARARTPLLLVSPCIEGNPLSGISDGRDFVQRLKKQAPNMQVFWLAEEGADEAEGAQGGADGWVSRPPATELSSDEERAAGELRATLLGRLAPCGSSDRPDPAGAARGRDESPQPEGAADSSEDLDRLKSVTAALREASSRGDVLPLVIRFASESFSRVAMFVVRGQRVAGMAQAGFEADGGPNDLEIRAMTFDTDECGWFRQAVEERRPLRGPAQDDGDRRLLAMLGGASPEEAFLAPIESGDQVIAILYADNLPAGRPIGDTSALEVVLHQAGLALERAVLERTLCEIEDEEGQ